VALDEFIHADWVRTDLRVPAKAAPLYIAEPQMSKFNLNAIETHLIPAVQ
jgi:hypothetical protein